MSTKSELVGNSLVVETSFKKGSHTDFTVKMHLKSSILEEFPDIQKYNAFEILQISVEDYLHNDQGPAYYFEGKLINVSHSLVQYFIEGKPITDKDEIAKIEHNKSFSNTLDQFLDE